MAFSINRRLADIAKSTGTIEATVDPAYAAQPNITSLGTLTTLSVDNITINTNDISSTGGTDLTITPLSGQQIVLDGTIVIDAGVVTGATSITSTAFVGALTGNVTGNASGTALTVTQAAQTAITSVGTLTGLVVNSGATNVVASFTSTDGYGAIQLADNGGNVELTAVGNDFHIQNAGAAAKMVVLNSGYVGIGDATPTELLEIASDSDPTILIRADTADSANSGKISFRENAGGSTGADLRYDGNVNKFIIDTSDVSNALVIKRTNGYVGIGTSSPDVLLHVEQAGEPPAEGMLILEANSSSRQLRIQPPTNADNGFIDFRGGNLTILDDGTEVARFQGGGLVGIGTNNPTYPLTVQKDVDTYIAKLENDGNSTSSNGLWVDTRWNTATNHVFRVTSNSGTTEQLMVLGSGNVGIGTASPTNALHIGPSTGAQMRFTNANTGHTSSDGLFIGVHNDGTPAQIIMYENAPLEFRTNDTPRMTIAADGDVMIGTTDSGYPAWGDNLTIGARSGNNGMTIGSATDGYGTFYFSDATGTAAGTYAGKIQYNHSNNTLVLTAGSGASYTTGITIDSTGNVGIGIGANIDSELHVYDASTSQINIEAADGDAVLKLECTGESYWNIFNDTSDSNKLNFYHNGGGTALTLMSTGFVGIGTTSPDAKLNVNVTDTDATPVNGTNAYLPRGSHPLQLFNDSNSAIYSGIHLRTRTTGASAWSINNAWTATYLGDLTFVSRTGASAAAEHMRITSAGKVGIGTTSPDYQLDIENSSHAMMRLHAGTNASASLRLQNDAQHWDLNCQTGDTFALYDHTRGAQPFSVLPNGNVGIGESNPINVLDIAYTGTDQNEGIQIHNKQYGGYGSAITWYSRNNAGYSSGADQRAARIKVAGANNWASSGNVSSSMFFETVSGETFATRMTILNDGRVGIGTTAPGADLDVADSGQAFIKVHTYSSTNADKAGIAFYKSASDTVGTVAATADGEDLGEISFNGANTSNQEQPAARIRAFSSEAPNSTRVPGSLQFMTTSTGDGELQTAMQIWDRSQVSIGRNTMSKGAMLDIYAGASEFNSWPYLYVHGVWGSVTGPMADFHNTHDGMVLRVKSGASRATTNIFEVRNSSNTGLFVRGDGQIGIGLDDPDELLHLKQAHAVIKLEDTAMSGAGFIDYDGVSLQFNTNRNPNTGAMETSTKSHAGFSLVGTANGASYIRFDTASAVNATATKAMHIDGEGNVGIGHDSGLDRLTVRSSANNSNVLDLQSADGDALFNVRQSNYNALLRGYADGSAQKIQIHAGGDSYFNGGNVGIGTTAPAKLFHVHLAADGSIIRLGLQSVCEWDFRLANTPYVSGGLSGDLELLPQNSNMAFTVGRAGQTGINMRAKDGVMTIGSGIKFNSDTADANMLDDYEEGSWTPTHTGASGASGVTYTYRSGTYTKIGQLVTCQAYYKLSDKGTLTGFAKITGLPFAPTGNPTFITGACVGSNWDLDADQQPVAMQYGTNSFLYLYVQEPDTALAQAVTGTFNDDSEVIITVSYNTAA